VKSLLDGHIVLKKELTTMGIYPAIDITTSISRLFSRLSDPSFQIAARGIVHAFSRLYKEREIMLLGGTPDRELRAILDNEKELCALISQSGSDRASWEDTGRQINETWNRIRESAQTDR
jgi:flagellum-specific ATP synthase